MQIHSQKNMKIPFLLHDSIIFKISLRSKKKHQNWRTLTPQHSTFLLSVFTHIDFLTASPKSYCVFQCSDILLFLAAKRPKKHYICYIQKSVSRQVLSFLRSDISIDQYFLEIFNVSFVRAYSPTYTYCLTIHKNNFWQNIIYTYLCK